MKVQRTFCLLLILITILSCTLLPSYAIEGTVPSIESRAILVTSEFDLDVPANTIITSSSSFSLDVGDTVVISAAYTPRSSNLDFGIIASNGQFYHVNVSGGVADITIDITRRGVYTFAIRNNSSNTVSVSGYLNY